MILANWLKKNWTHPVWSSVFAGLILAVILTLGAKFFQLINWLVSYDTINQSLSNFNFWLSKDSQISNLTLLLLLVFIGIVVTISIYKFITKKWLGKTEIFFASDNSYIVRGTYSVDLDLGVQGNGLNDADFWWEQKTITERSIVPLNGAQFCIVGQTSKGILTKEELSKLIYSDQTIQANDNNSNKIPTGTVVAYKTKNGRFGTMKIIEYGYNLKIEFYTLKLANE